MRIEPWVYSYRLLGKAVKPLLPHFEDLHNSLREAGVKISFSAYVSMMLFSSILAFTASLIILPLAFFILNVPLNPTSGILVLLISLSSGIITLLVIYSYPKVKASARKNPIELNLTYILNFFTLLSSSNVPPRSIFRALASIGTLKSVQKEFRDIVRDVEIFGRDLLSAIVDNMKYTPSKSLRDILNGYVATIRTGGDPTEFLRLSTENAMKDRMIKLDRMLESLSALAEIYIMVLVAMPLLFVVMFATFGMLGGESSGMMSSMLYLLTYAFIPIAGAFLIVVLSTYEVG